MSNEKVRYWRNEDGKIQCPGDSCPAKCDNNCPIWLNKKGLILLNSKEYLQAIEYLKQATALDFLYVEAFNNMGKAYRYLEKYEEAKKNHMQALICDMHCKETLYELEYVCRCLRDYDNAHRFKIMLEKICVEEERERIEKFKRNYKV